MDEGGNLLKRAERERGGWMGAGFYESTIRSVHKEKCTVAFVRYSTPRVSGTQAHSG